MRSSIKNVQAGRGVTVCGTITEVDQAPMTVSVGTDNRLAYIYHVTLTDEDASIQVTVWDRVPEFANFKLGENMMMSNVTVKGVSGFFAEFGRYAANFGQGSTAGRVPADVDTSQWRKVSVRVAAQTHSSSPTSHASRTTSPPAQGELDARQSAGLKRSRESIDTVATCEHCDTPAEPFCETTGKAHDSRCALCNKILARALFCCKTGLTHGTSVPDKF